VVNFRDHVRWFDSRPLFGRRALVMHSNEQPDDLADLLRSEGAEVIDNTDAHVDVYRQLLDRKIDLVTFTSASAVLNFAANFGADQVSDLLTHTVVAIQGEAAADAAGRADIAPAVQAPAGPPSVFARANLSEFRGHLLPPLNVPSRFPGTSRVFFPATDLAGAGRGGKRLEAGVGQIEGVVGQGGVAVRPTVSVGIAALKPGKGVSFARLVRDAGMALRAAQLKGGARVVVKT